MDFKVFVEYFVCSRIQLTTEESFKFSKFLYSSTILIPKYLSVTVEDGARFIF